MKKEGTDADRPLYTLGIASQLSNIPAHSIRQYINRGLLIPFKLDSKRHLFSASDIKRLNQIHFLIHEKGLNFAGIRTLMATAPCWAIRRCSKSERELCTAYTDIFNPCWEASGKGRVCKNENCRECQVYKIIDMEVNPKMVIKHFL